MSKATISRTKTFKSERDALRFIRDLRVSYNKYGFDRRDSYGAQPTTDGAWIVTRYLADSSFSMPVQEIVEVGVTFGKPEGDGIMDGATTQDILLDGTPVGYIECEWIVDYEHATSRVMTRKGTERYTVSFFNGHPLSDCEFHFEVQSPSRHYTKVAEADYEHHDFSVVYPDARKALAAAKRFAKAVLS